MSRTEQLDPVCWVDCETTGLDPDRHEIWEVGLILPDGREFEWQLPVDLSRADPIALNIGRFHDRRVAPGTENYGPFPDFVDNQPEGGKFVLHPARLPEWCSAFVEATRGLHLAGAVVSFDAERLARLLRANGECPMWHYHLIDVEALSVGWIAGNRAAMYAKTDNEGWLGSEACRPPWNSEALSAALGIKPDQESRHTALGDARWAKAIYEAVMGA